MKLFSWMKDGGPESRVWGFFLIEWKRFFSIALLFFKDGSREAYHSHAFNAISWVLRGKLTETRKYDTRPEIVDGGVTVTDYLPSFRPIITTRSNMHRVSSTGKTWVITFRGPWADTWMEYLPKEHRFVTLTNGRQEIA